MGKDEAVALLLELANVEEASYLKDQPGEAWPPEAVSPHQWCSDECRVAIGSVFIGGVEMSAG